MDENFIRQAEDLEDQAKTVFTPKLNQHSKPKQSAIIKAKLDPTQLKRLKAKLNQK